MNHIDGLSSEPEVVLFCGRTHPKVIVWPVLIQFALLCVHWLLFVTLGRSLGQSSGVMLVLHALVLAAEVWFVVVPVLRWRFATFEVTTVRVRKRWGVLNKHSQEIHLDRITQVNEERDLIDRVFFAGTFVIYDAANASGIRFHDVPHFKRVRETLEDARHGAFVG